MGWVVPNLRVFLTCRDRCKIALNDTILEGSFFIHFYPLKFYFLMSLSRPFVDTRIRKDKFYTQVNHLIDWSSIEDIIGLDYTDNVGSVGRRGYSGLLLFKMLLIGMWHGLSDYETEEVVNDSLSANRFCGLNLEERVPDHSVLSRFRTHLTHCGTFERLLDEINTQLTDLGVMVKQGHKVDASITQTQRKPRGKKAYTLSADESLEEYQPARVDKQARWVVKRGKPQYGYKKHILTDEEGLVQAIETTPANTHDSQPLEALIDKAGCICGTQIEADKAYRSKRHDDLLKSKGLVNGIQYRSTRAKALTLGQKRHNKHIAKTRYKVERTFGSMVRWFGAGVCRYMGLEKTHTQHLLEGICYNLKRAPKLYVKSIEAQFG